MNWKTVIFNNLFYDLTIETLFFSNRHPNNRAEIKPKELPIPPIM